MSDTEDTDGLGKSFETLNIKTLTVENIDIPSTDADNQFGTIKLSDNLEIAGDGLILHDLDNLEFSISDDNKIITYEDNSTATANYASNTVITSSVSKTISTEENINLNGRTYTITQTGTTITLVEPLKKIISLEGGNLVIATYKSSGLRIDKEVIMDSNNSISEITNAAFDLKIKSLDVTKTNSINDTIPNEGCVRIDDTLTVAGATTLNGVVTLGDSTGDDITINGRMASNIVPKTDATYDLGTTTLGFKDLHLGSGGIINLDGGDVTLTHSAGKLTLGGDGTVEFDFDNHEMTNVDINSGAIDGVTIGTNTACTSLVATTVAINGGSIDSTTIGFTTPSTGTFTTLTVNDALIIAAGATITGDTANQITLAITGVSGQSANLLTIEKSDGTDKLTVNSDGVTTAVSLVANTADINGGSIDGVTIGTNTACTQLVVDNINIDGTTIGHTSDTDLITLEDGSVTFTGTTVIPTADINGGSIDGVTIGTNTACTQLVVDNINIDGTTIGHTSDPDLITLEDGSVTFTGTTVIPTADINGGSIDGVTIGTNTACTQLVVDNINIDGTTIGHTSDPDLITLEDGSVTFTGTTVIPSADINGGAIDGVTIGSITPSTGTFTNLTTNNFIINTPQTINVGGSGITETDETYTTAPTNSIVYLKATDDLNVSIVTYVWTLDSFNGTEGQMLHIFFNNAVDTNVKLKITFGLDRLATGSGTNEALIFSSRGQSASLIYIDSIWCILNTGASVL